MALVLLLVVQCLGAEEGVFSSAKWPALRIFLLKKPVRLIVRNF
jgi:hypothetical protein